MVNWNAANDATEEQQYLDSLKKRIAKLEKALREIADSPCGPYEYIERLRVRIAKLEKALREIANHPHCASGHFTTNSKYEFGSKQGHLCAAKIAQEGLEEK